MSETEMRGVLRSLTGALVYLRTERVLHRELNLSNIYVHADFRVKLSGFDIACRLPNLTSTLEDYDGFDNRVAPEIVTRIPYSFPADVWSLGSAIVVCLTGCTPIVRFVRSKSHVEYDLPGALSEDALSLIAALLHADPKRRLEVDQINSHVFMGLSLPSTPLALPMPSTSAPSGLVSRTTSSVSSQNRPKYPKSLAKPATSTVPRSISAPTVVPKTGPSLLVLHDDNSRSRLRDYLFSTGSFVTAPLGRRIASAPGPSDGRRFLNPGSDKQVLETPPLTDSEDSLRSFSDDDTASHHSENSLQEDLLIRHPLLRLPKTIGKLKPTIVPSPDCAKPALLPPATEASKEMIQSTPLVPAPPPTKDVPASDSQGALLTTSYLTSQTHKVSKGQIVVLPSSSLLIDFREGERRSGRKGVEVLCVTSDGHKIGVYSAPHLSTPCCLVEPVASYNLGDLPPVYRKQYDDAARVVDQLRQRIPKLVLHRPEARYTLMANDPSGDIEILSPTPAPKRDKENKSSLSLSQLRIRFLRRSRTVEISSYVGLKRAGTGTSGEWKRKVLRVVDDNSAELRFLDADTFNLDQDDWDGLALLGSFIPICNTVARWGSTTCFQPQNSRPISVQPNDASRKSVQQSVADGTQSCQHAFDLTSPIQQTSHVSNRNTVNTSALATASTTVLSQLDVTPRPAKLSLFPQSSSGRLSADARQDQLDDQSSLCASEAPPVAKFLPTIGWCTRSKSASDSVYRVLFLDGASLLVNINSGAIELANADGSVERCFSGVWSSAIQQRMQVFGRVVDLFASE